MGFAHQIKIFEKNQKNLERFQIFCICTVCGIGNDTMECLGFFEQDVLSLKMSPKLFQVGDKAGEAVSFFQKNIKKRY